MAIVARVSEKEMNALFVQYCYCWYTASPTSFHNTEGSEQGIALELLQM